MKLARPHRPVRAFTRLELAAIVAGVALVGLIVLPALASTRPRSHRIVCLNNLRQIGTALQFWGHDHGDQPPFEVPLNVGGTRAHALSPNVWLHFSWISNGIATPEIFLCPSDTGRPARDFSVRPESGYLHPNFANRATSYFVSHPFYIVPSAVVSGDRNITFETSTGCSRLIAALHFATQPLANTRWTNGLHNGAGNILRLDGRAEPVSTAGLQEAFVTPKADNGNAHFITPR